MTISAEQFEKLLPLACAWAAEEEKTILARGKPLSEPQIQDAHLIGVAAPGNVRLLAVDQIPVPQNPVLKQAAKLTGLISPHTAGLTLRFGIWIRKDCWGDRALVAHELVHVLQYERMGGIEPFLRQYLWECLTDGYPGGALEQEAIVGARRVSGSANTGAP
jgi:hypothetical protein